MVFFWCSTIRPQNASCCRSFPLLIAGFLTEIEHLAKMLRSGLRHQDFGQRVVAAGFGAVVAAVLIGAMALQGYMSFVYLKQSADQQRAKLTDRRAAYQWMSARLPGLAAVLSYDDSLLYLYSGHGGNYKPLMPRWWYAEDHASMVDAHRNLPAYCASRGLTYVYFTTEDLSRETGEEDAWRSSGSFAPTPLWCPFSAPESEPRTEFVLAVNRVFDGATSWSLFHKLKAWACFLHCL